MQAHGTERPTPALVKGNGAASQRTRLLNNVIDGLNQESSSMWAFSAGSSTLQPSRRTCNGFSVLPRSV